MALVDRESPPGVSCVDRRHAPRPPACVGLASLRRGWAVCYSLGAGRRCSKRPVEMLVMECAILLQVGELL